MKLVLTFVVALALTGCATTAAPNFYNGSYYMAGDSNCARFRAIAESRVMCMDKNGNDVGYRDAMTPEQMQMYQLQLVNQQIQLQQVSQQLQQTSQTIQNANQQLLQQQPTAPVVAPITPPGGYQTTCLVNGVIVSCRSN